MTVDPKVVEAWDAEYRNGRYSDDPPDPFVDEILSAARSRGLVGGPALEVGCGNGRNYRALVAGGLDVLGLDISATALAQLAARSPERRGKLVLGDLDVLPAGATYPVVVGLQVFQHGDRATAHDHLRRAQRRVPPGGLFGLRVNAVGTDLAHAHEVVERGPDGGFTVRYTSGPKAGLLVRFFAREELTDLFRPGFAAVLPLRAVATARDPPATGRWVQWEAIWERTAPVPPAQAGPSSVARTASASGNEGGGPRGGRRISPRSRRTTASGAPPPSTTRNRRPRTGPIRRR